VSDHHESAGSVSLSKAEFAELQALLKGMATWPSQARSVEEFLTTPVCGAKAARLLEESCGLKTATHRDVQRLALAIRDFVLEQHPAGTFTPFGRGEAFLLAGHLLFGTSFQGKIDGPLHAFG
jgi:hypothetical protein